MSLLAARASLRQVAIRRTGLRHSSGHGEYSPVPFSYNNKAAFGLKVTAYLVTGFSIPFVAAYYQMRKSAGTS